MKFISVIPARANSKGIKNKNIYPLNGKPMISYTFREIKKSKLKNNFVLTDSSYIKRLSKSYNINSEYKRPKKVSKDTTSLSETLYHFYQWTKKKNIQFDYLVILQPTSPLRNYLDINKALNIVEKSRCKSLFSISQSLEHPYEVIKKNKKGWNYILKKSKDYYRRQDFDLKTFFINGAIYITHKDLIKKKKIFNYTNHRFLKMSKKRSIEINDREEMKIVQSMLNNL